MHRWPGNPEQALTRGAWACPLRAFRGVGAGANKGKAWCAVYALQPHGQWPHPVSSLGVAAVSDQPFLRLAVASYAENRVQSSLVMAVEAGSGLFGMGGHGIWACLFGHAWGLLL